MGRRQLYCAVQSRSPSHCQTTTEKVQSSARNGMSSATDDGRLFHAEWNKVAPLNVRVQNTTITRTSETLDHHMRATVVHPRLSRGERRSSCHPWIRQCIGMQPFLNSSELYIISCSPKNFTMIFQTVREFLH